ncbi:MAG: hypothetical protein BRC40_16080 [Cyanobacteria bacterium QH_8_48_120]|nr:MAG: hypothetical protein BRC39_02920 [Cyanobacteria bacterium QH_7_48_89]PSO68981.1 MAG: hypothetical protein BRC40_16080 [Cyanobacteria bacterium QH_8_48_120]
MVKEVLETDTLNTGKTNHMTPAEIETLLKEIKEEILGEKPKDFNKLGIDKITHFKVEKTCSSDRKFRSEKTHCLIRKDQ